MRANTLNLNLNLNLIILKNQSALGTNRRLGAQLGPTIGARQIKLDTASRASDSLLVDGRAALGTKRLIASRALGCPGGQLGLAGRAEAGSLYLLIIILKLHPAAGANRRLGRQLDSAFGAKQLKLCAATLATHIVRADGRAAFGAQRLFARRALGRIGGHGLATGRALAAKGLAAASAGRLVGKDARATR